METKKNDSKGLPELEKEKLTLETRLQEAVTEKKYDIIQDLSKALSAIERRIETAKKEEKDLLRLSELEARKREHEVELTKATHDRNYARVGEIAKTLEKMNREIKDLRAETTAKPKKIRGASDEDDTTTNTTTAISNASKSVDGDCASTDAATKDSLARADGAERTRLQNTPSGTNDGTGDFATLKKRDGDDSVNGTSSTKSTVLQLASSKESVLTEARKEDDEDGASAAASRDPTERGEYDIFISYRRERVTEARLLKNTLERLGKYKVFLDTVRGEGLGVGNFQEQLEKVLRETPVVIVMVTPPPSGPDQTDTGGIDRSKLSSMAHIKAYAEKNWTDWCRLEMATALRLNKIIVPVFPGVKGGSFVGKELGRLSGLTDVEAIRNKMAFPWYDDMYDESVQKIVDELRKKIRPRQGQDTRENGDAAAVETSETNSTIVLLRCSPKVKGRLVFSQEEIEGIQKVWSSGRLNGSAVKLVSLESGDAMRLHEKMRAPNLCVVHISAHLNCDLLGGNSILFVDENGKESTISEDKFVDMLATFKDSLELIVLNGCCSQSAAWKLIKKGAKAVIGWRSAVNDEAANLFGVELHKAMASGLPPIKAFESAKEVVKSVRDDGLTLILSKEHPDVSPNKFVLEDPRAKILTLFGKDSAWKGRIQKPSSKEMLYRIPAGIPIFFSRAYVGHRECAPPRLGADFVGGLRGADVEKVKTLILESSKGGQVDRDSDEATKSNEAVRTRRKIGVHGVNGLGGLGKTVLAKQLCSLDDMRRHFYRGGMFWLTASNENPLEELRKLVHDLVKMHAPDADLEKELGACVDLETALEKSFELFKRVDVPVLVVLDDVWEAKRVKQLVPMDALPKGSVVLMTYRKQSIGEIVGAESYALKKLSKRSALALFETKSGVKCADDKTREIVELLVKRLGHHPMAIAIVGGLARRRLLGVDSDLKVVYSTLRDIQEKLKDGFVDEGEDEDSSSETASDGETWLRKWLAGMELGECFDAVWKAGFRTKKRVRDRMTVHALEKYCSSLAPMDIDEILDGVKKLKDEESKREILKKERRHTCVKHCIGESVKFLEKAERDCFMEFAIFPEDTSIPYGVLARLMPEMTQDRLSALVDASLVERSASSGLVSYQLHDLCRDYVREATKDKRGEMHLRFLNAGGDASVDGVPLHGYRSRLNRTGDSGAATKTTDISKHDDDVNAYIANQACWHMLEAVKCGVEEARTMMIKTAFSVSWLEARARQRARGGGVGAVLTDLLTASDAMAASKQKKDSQALSRVIGLVRSAVGMSAQTLTEKPEMMAECLWQRLVLHCRDETSGGASLKAEAGTTMLKGLVLRDAERRRKEVGGLCGLGQPWMNSAGGALLRTLKGHAKSVTCSTVLTDWGDGRLDAAFGGMGTYVVSGSEDNTIKIWNPLTGACVQTLKGHSHVVRSVTELYDRSTSGRLSRSLCGAGEDGAGDDGCRAFVVSGSGDETIKIWNPLTGACVQTLKGHSDNVKSVTVLYDRSTNGHLSRALCGAGEDGAGDDGCRAFVVSGSICRRLAQDHPHRHSTRTTTYICGSRQLRRRRLAQDHPCRHPTRTTTYPCAYEPPPTPPTTDRIVSRILRHRHRDHRRSTRRDGEIQIWNLLTGACVRTLKGHSRHVNSVTVLYDHSASGRLSRALCGAGKGSVGDDECRAFVVSGSMDRTIKIWSPLTGVCVQTLKGHSNEVRSVTVLYDRSTSGGLSRALCGAGEDGAGDDGCRAFVVSGSEDNTIKIWNPLTGSCVRTLKGHSDWGSSVTVLEDRSTSGGLSRALCCAGEDGAGDGGCRAFVVSGSRDKTIKIWNLLTGACVQTLKGHSWYVLCVTVLYDRSTSGRLSRALCGAGEDGAGDDGCRAFVVSVSYDKTIKIWNPLTGAATYVQKFEGHSKRVTSVTVLYDRSTGGRLSRALCGAGEDGTDNDGCRAFVVSGSGDATIKIWNPLTGACVQTLKGHSSFVKSVTVLYDRSTNCHLSCALCGAGEDGEGDHGCPAFVVSGSDDKMIKIWNPLTGACVQTLKGHSKDVESVTVLYNRSTSGLLSRALCGAGEDGARDDECRAFVVSGSMDETIKIWNPVTGACVQTLKGHSGWVYSVTVLYDRSTSGGLSRALCGEGEDDGAGDDGYRAFVVSGSFDNTIKIWNPLTGACVQTLKGHSSTVRSVAVLEDRSTSVCLSGVDENGRSDVGCHAYVVSGSMCSETAIKIWNPLTGSCVRTLKGHSHVVSSVTMLYDRSTNGRLSRALCRVGEDGAGDDGCRAFVVSGSEDKTIKIWHPITGACLISYSFDAPVKSVVIKSNHTEYDGLTASSSASKSNESDETPLSVIEDDPVVVLCVGLESGAVVTLKLLPPSCRRLGRDPFWNI